MTMKQTKKTHYFMKVVKAKWKEKLNFIYLIEKEKEKHILDDYTYRELISQKFFII